MTTSKAKHEGRFRFWFPTGLSLVAIIFTGFQFYYFNLRDVRNAVMSIVAAEHTYVGDRSKSVLAIKALISNGGTTPVALQQVVWTLSALQDPEADRQQKIQWLYRPGTPVVVQGRSVEVLDFDFACYDTINGDFPEVARLLTQNAPSFLRQDVNFAVYYWSSISALVVDVDGDLHQATARAGRLGFGGGADDGLVFSMSLGDFRDLPLKLQLLPSRKLNGIKDLRRIWLPAHYSNLGGPAVGSIDTTGWDLASSEQMIATFRAWVDSTGMAVRP